MHLKSLKVFCDVVRRRSFSRAATENGMSQSGASQVVNQLETLLGVQLIDRTRRPFGLTGEGKVFYDGARKLLVQYDALVEDVRVFNAEVAGRVRVASIYSVGLNYMNLCVQAFLTNYPQANVRIEYLHPHRVYEAVETDQADLGLISYPKPSRSLAVIPWRDEPVVLVCSPGHRLAGARSVSLEDLAGEKMIGFECGLTIRREIDRVLAAHHVEVDLVMEFDNIETIKRAVEIGAGISLLPTPTVRREVEVGTLVTVPLKPIELVRPLGILHRRGKELGTTARRFIEAVRNEGQIPSNAKSGGEKDNDRNAG